MKGTSGSLGYIGVGNYELNGGCRVESSPSNRDRQRPTRAGAASEDELTLNHLTPIGFSVNGLTGACFIAFFKRLAGFLAAMRCLLLSEIAPLGAYYAYM
jgi:hypothetical protein